MIKFFKRHRINYWSCTDFADWIRGSDKLTYGTADEWKSWHEDAKIKSIRYWIAEELLDVLQGIWLFIPDISHSIIYYVRNRWMDQTNALVAHSKHIKSGDWCDLDHRILYCLFDELVDFVEIEKALSNVRSGDVVRPKFWQSGKWRLGNWRDAELGKDHLNWEVNLIMDKDYTNDPEQYGTPTPQSISASEILALYEWWTVTYPNRIDAYDKSGWSAYCDDKRARGIGFMETDPMEDREKTAVILKTSNEIDAEYDQEDEDMLIRLIKIRKSLWT